MGFNPNRGQPGNAGQFAEGPKKGLTNAPTPSPAAAAGPVDESSGPSAQAAWSAYTAKQPTEGASQTDVSPPPQKKRESKARENATRNRAGFPLRACLRCGGTGEFSFNAVHGNMCYGCSGTGWQLVPAARTAYAEYHKALQKQKEPTYGDLQPGDVIKEGDEWREVVEVAVNEDDPQGWMTTPDGSRIPVAYRCRIRFADGTDKTTSTSYIVPRRGTVDPGPYVESLPASAWRQATQREPKADPSA